MASFDDAKAQGNQYFIDGKYNEAIAVYTSILETHEPSTILLTNRSAAYFHLNMLEKALIDANAAISLDKKWLKAYYRKASALEALGRHREAYQVWQVAAIECEATSSLIAQINSSKAKWMQHYKREPVQSSEDLVERYCLLTEPRERLSTLAHFWNDSTEAERFDMLNYFISMIGGAGMLSEASSAAIAEHHLHALPLHNYVDLPRVNVEVWCDYFKAQQPTEKTYILSTIWPQLTHAQQTAVVTDLQAFFNPTGPPAAICGDDEDDVEADLTN